MRYIFPCMHQLLLKSRIKNVSVETQGEQRHAEAPALVTTHTVRFST